LTPVGSHSLWGRNALCVSSQPDVYFHELRFRVLGTFLLGAWFNVNSTNLGGVQLHIKSNGHLMVGTHIGNANNNRVESGSWEWVRIKDGNLSHDDISKLGTRTLKPFSTLEASFSKWLKRAQPVGLDHILSPEP